VRIETVELRRLRLPLVRAFETSFGRTDTREFLLVRAAGEGIAGWGECVAEQDPFYSAETTATAWGVLRDHLVPALLSGPVAHPRDVWTRLSHVRGHRMAKASLEMAAWDLFARQQGVPLARLLGGTRDEIASGVSIGIQPSLDALATRVDEAVSAGYQRVKIKVKPGYDLAPVQHLRERYPGLALMVDANAAYTLEDTSALQALDAWELTMIEQPLDEEDLLHHARLQRSLRTAVCLDESIVSARRAEEAFALGACRIVNIKPGRVGGHAESIALHDACARHGVPVWHGGMLESGIGRAHNVHLASLPNFSLPGDIAASARYYRPDLVDPEFVVSARGTMCVPDGPGIGVAVVEDRVVHATLDHLTLP
jgi:O-succinylbenzoate synthase